MRVDPRVYVCRYCQGQVIVTSIHANALLVECTDCTAGGHVFLDDTSRCYVIRHGQFLRLVQSPLDQDIEVVEDWTLVDLAYARRHLRAAMSAHDFDVAKCSCRDALAALDRIAFVVEPYLTFLERSCS